MPSTLSAATADGDAPARPSGTTERVVTVIDAIVRRGDVGVRELAQAVDISRSATHRTVQALARMRVLNPLPGGRYEPGSRLLAWASYLSRREPVLSTASDLLGGLAASTHETTYLLGYRPGAKSGVVLDVWPGTRPIRYFVAVGSVLPLYAGAASKAVLAWLGPEFMRSLDRPRLTDGTFVDADALEEELEVIRRQGYAISVGERIADAIGVAAPFFRDGAVAGAANFTIPRYHLGETDLAHFGELARNAADRITEAATVPDQAGRPVRGRSVLGADAPSTDGREVARVVDVIDVLTRVPVGGVAAAELAEDLGTRPATMRGVLGSLVAANMARENPAGRFETDVQVMTWPGLLPDRSVVRVARDLVAELVAKVDETVCLLTFDAVSREARFVICQESAKPIQYVVPVGSLAPLHAGAAGKAILAHLPRAEWPRAPLRRYSRNTITSLTALERDLEEVRRRRFATSIGEHLPDAAGVAAPFFVDGAVGGSMTITMPLYRFDAAKVQGLSRELLACCAELTELLSPDDSG